MSIFARLFKVGQAQAHNIVDKLEDPIKLTEQGIRDLKKDLQGAMQGLAEVKGIAIRLGKESEEARRHAEEYERKAHAAFATRHRRANGCRRGGTAGDAGADAA